MLRTGSTGFLLAISIMAGSCFALPSTDLHASKRVQRQERQSRCKRCSERRLSPDREQRVYKNFYKKSESSRLSMGGSEGSSPSSISSRGCFSSAIAFHRITYTSTEDTKRLGDVITIKDGSQWSIAESDREIVKRWDIGTPIAFSPNSLSTWAYFTGGTTLYKYRVTNLETNESVEANLSKGPFLNSMSARRIRRLDKQSGTVHFNDGSIWNCNPYGDDGVIFNEWKVSDFVLLGRNDTWYSFNKNDIIINVSADNWLPAERSM